MRILITNDDGINAPGLEVLTENAIAIAGPKGEVWTVAPAFKLGLEAFSQRISLCFRQPIFDSCLICFSIRQLHVFDDAKITIHFAVVHYVFDGFNCVHGVLLMGAEAPFG